MVDHTAEFLLLMIWQHSTGVAPQCQQRLSFVISTTICLVVTENASPTEVTVMSLPVELSCFRLRPEEVEDRDSREGRTWAGKGRSRRPRPETGGSWSSSSIFGRLRTWGLLSTEGEGCNSLPKGRRIMKESNLGRHNPSLTRNALIRLSNLADNLLW